MFSNVAWEIGSGTFFFKSFRACCCSDLVCVRRSTVHTKETLKKNSQSCCKFQIALQGDSYFFPSSPLDIFLSFLFTCSLSIPWNQKTFYSLFLPLHRELNDFKPLSLLSNLSSFFKTTKEIPLLSLLWQSCLRVSANFLRSLFSV